MEEAPRFIDRREIERIADQVRASHGLSTIPIDPVLLAGRLGIRVMNAKFSEENLVGMISRRGMDATIYVNQSDPPSRKRFTIAHELGHHFLHLKNKDGEFVDGEADLFRSSSEEGEANSGKKHLEIQANIFGASLLMPRHDVIREWEIHRSVSTLAQMFNVSETAMGFRVAQLGLS